MSTAKHLLSSTRLRTVGTVAQPKASTLSSWIAFEGAVLPREPGFPGAHSPRCRWSCSQSRSPRSCRTRCSLTPHYWNVLTPLVREAAVGHCKATRGAIRGSPMPLPIHLLLESKNANSGLLSSGRRPTVSVRIGGQRHQASLSSGGRYKQTNAHVRGQGW